MTIIWEPEELCVGETHPDSIDLVQAPCSTHVAERISSQRVRLQTQAQRLIDTSRKCYIALNAVIVDLSILFGTPGGKTCTDTSFASRL